LRRGRGKAESLARPRLPSQHALHRGPGRLTRAPCPCARLAASPCTQGTDPVQDGAAREDRPGSCPGVGPGNRKTPGPEKNHVPPSACACPRNKAPSDPGSDPHGLSDPGRIRPGQARPICGVRHGGGPVLPQTGRGPGHGLQGRERGQAGPTDLQGPRVQLDPTEAVPHTDPTTQQPGLHNRPGRTGQEVGLQVPAELSLLRHLGGPGQAVHPQGLAGQVPRRAGTSRERVHPGHPPVVSRRQRHARHGADRK